ncbi:MAG TPA: hypothetical protein VFE58_06375 [Tepidisphaeraceae bacterium]|nr:hypothetical protein [Tepidisphaeraceae bacterium]
MAQRLLLGALRPVVTIAAAFAPVFLFFVLVKKAWWLAPKVGISKAFLTHNMNWMIVVGAYGSFGVSFTLIALLKRASSDDGLSEITNNPFGNWNPRGSFYRLDPRGKYIRTLWTGPVAMAIIFTAFYIPSRRAGVPIYWPLITPSVIFFPWLQQLFATRALWKQSEQTTRSDEET